MISLLQEGVLTTTFMSWTSKITNKTQLVVDYAVNCNYAIFAFQMPVVDFVLNQPILVAELLHVSIPLRVADIAVRYHSDISLS